MQLAFFGLICRALAEPASMSAASRHLSATDSSEAASLGSGASSESLDNALQHEQQDLTFFDSACDSSDIFRKKLMHISSLYRETQAAVDFFGAKFLRSCNPLPAKTATTDESALLGWEG